MARITGKKYKISGSIKECYKMLFSVIYYILLGLTKIIKFLFGHFFAATIYYYEAKNERHPF